MNPANAKLVPSDACFNLIKQSEGMRLKAYWDVDGYSIGYGHHSSDITASTIWTVEQAESVLDNDVMNSCTQLDKLIDVPLTQGQYDALTDFVFNEGIGHLQGSTLLKLLNDGDYPGASLQFKLWDIANGQPNEALAVRRNAEFELWNGG